MDTHRYKTLRNFISVLKVILYKYKAEHSQSNPNLKHKIICIYYQARENMYPVPSIGKHWAKVKREKTGKHCKVLENI